jgi:hypothetical protein
MIFCEKKTFKNLKKLLLLHYDQQIQHSESNLHQNLYFYKMKTYQKPLLNIHNKITEAKNGKIQTSNSNFWLLLLHV